MLSREKVMLLMLVNVALFWSNFCFNRMHKLEIKSRDRLFRDS